MTRPTLSESMREFDAAIREVGAVIGDALEQTGVFRAIVRFSLWADDRFPMLGRIADRAPRWMMFGTDEFWTLFMALYLIVAGVVLVAALVA